MPVSVTCPLCKRAGKVPRIRKDYLFETKDSIKGEPLMRIAGRGVIAFDCDQHVPVELTFQGDLAAHGEPKRVHATINIKSKLVDDEQMPAPEHYAEATAPERVPTPSAEPAPDPAKRRPGLLAEYFRGADFRERVVSRVDPDLNFDWSHGSPDPALLPDTFGARWAGYLLPPVEGTYVLKIRCDNGARWTLGDRTLYDYLTVHRQHEHEITVRLTTDPHRMRVDYLEGVLTAWCQLSWKKPGATTFEPIPAESFFHTNE